MAVSSSRLGMSSFRHDSREIGHDCEEIGEECGGDSEGYGVRRVFYCLVINANQGEKLVC